jgi:predicted RNase H-like HicB family nuclease
MRYTAVLEREADGGYVATLPALPVAYLKVTLVMRS